MFKILLSFVLSIFIYGYSFAQDTIYLKTSYEDKYVRANNMDDAVYYHVVRPYKDGLLESTRYDKKDGKVYTAIVLAEDSLTREGMCTLYFSSGKEMSKGYYSMDKKSGTWEDYYFESGNIHAKIPFKNDTINGTLYTYYETGELKREETRYGDELISGKCYKINGKEREFTPYITMPKFGDSKDDLMNYLSSVIKYPKDCISQNIQGRTVLKFVVNKKGKVKDVEVIQSAHPLLDEEAVRVVKYMPAWEPGMSDDEKADVCYTLPITFRFED